METLKSLNQLSSIILNCAYRVHSTLGPGLFESVYEAALAYELKVAGFNVERQKSLPVIYNDVKLDEGFRIDLLVDDRIIIELKAVKDLEPIHKAQLITYLKLADKDVGLLINFNTVSLKDGILRCFKNKKVITEDEYYSTDRL